MRNTRVQRLTAAELVVVVVLLLRLRQEFFGVFFPPLLSLFTKWEKMPKNTTTGRRENTYYMRDLEALTSAAQGLTYRPLRAAEIASARLYRALAYAPVTVDTQKRSTMAKRVGVTARTAIEYDRLASVGVTPQVYRRTVTVRAEPELPARRKDAPRNVWLESTAGRKFKPTRAACPPHPREWFSQTEGGSQAGSHTRNTTCLVLNRKETNHHEQ